jgi:maleate isomerase
MGGHRVAEIVPQQDPPMSTTVEYAPAGLVGVLTPQANTTVEPELQLLCPPGVALLTARMCSTAPDLQARLRDYYDHPQRWTAQFANAPLGVVASACTGSSYLIGADAEDEMFAEWSRSLQVPVTNSALAVIAAMRALGARRLSLVSPYPAALTDASRAYWQSRGLEVVRVERLATDASRFHPIYALGSAAVRDGIARLGDDTADAVLLLGTGTPTLGAIAQPPGNARAVPVVSCNLALLWHALELMRGHAAAPRAHTLRALLAEPRWRRRLGKIVPESPR